MARVNPERVTAEIEGDFVVFLIGIRVNNYWKIHKWLPAMLAMPRMLRELDALPSEDTGFLGHTGLSTGVIVQYWRSFEHLEAYARSMEHTHFPAWTAFNKRMKGARGDVGIWHETYLIGADQYESVYSGMPAFGLGRASKLVPATGNRSEARKRLNR
jgi:hypothetical protein